jgi:serine/threonine-protein kinase
MTAAGGGGGAAPATGGRPGAGGAPSGGAGGGASGGASGAGAGGAPAATGTLFPPTSPWYQDISGAALDGESEQIIRGLAQRGGWGNGNIMQIDFSIEVVRAGPTVEPRPFQVITSAFFQPACDLSPIPVPPGGRIEGSTSYACNVAENDCHLIVIQGTKLYESWKATIAGGTATGSPFRSGCLAVWDLTRDHWRPDSQPYGRGEQCTSADAAGYPIAALLFTADEVKAGAINHAIRFILPNDRIRKGAYVHPATHSGVGTGTPTPDTVPYGARFRLKKTFDLARLPNEGARVVARAMQKYGMFLADGGNIALTAQSDALTAAKWQGLLAPRDLSAIKVTDFDMIEAGPRVPLTYDCKRTPLR